MRSDSRFRHQTYTSERPSSSIQLLPNATPVEPSSEEFHEALAAVGSTFAHAGVAAVYCVHGTFSGNDALGLLTELARFAPQLSKTLSKIGKHTVNLIAGETGNYTPQFVATLQEKLSAGADPSIPVRLFNWSSQNNHIGRADGAVRLIHELAQLATDLPTSAWHAECPPRVMLWGHSHGGNVFALLTNLLGADTESRDAFFYAARTFYRPWLRRTVDLPIWQTVCELLNNADHPLRRLKIDIATFGTPVRYGWDSDGYSNLLHFIHHRPPQNGHEYQAPVPIEPRRMFVAADGDYIQQIGIAGTNWLPNLLALRTLIADWRLDKLLEHDLPRERILARLAHGTRVPDAGSTLLVDYQAIESGIHRNLAGHALYTRRKWLPFHCREIATKFYEP